MTDSFPFDDLDKLYQEEDDLPVIPDWPSIFTNEPATEKTKDCTRD